MYGHHINSHFLCHQDAVSLQRPRRNSVNPLAVGIYQLCSAVLIALLYPAVAPSFFSVWSKCSLSLIYATLWPSGLKGCQGQEVDGVLMQDLLQLWTHGLVYTEIKPCFFLYWLNDQISQLYSILPCIEIRYYLHFQELSFDGYFFVLRFSQKYIVTWLLLHVTWVHLSLFSSVLIYFLL